MLRPKTNGETAHFYTLVTRDTRETEFAQHRQMFLTEQGYSYAIADEADVKNGTLGNSALANVPVSIQTDAP